MANNKPNKLVIDEKALERLGLHGETIYVVEYDMPSRFPLTKAQKSKLTKEQLKADEIFRKLARKFRNDLIYELKFNLNATKHLESNWLIEGDKLEVAVDHIEEIKTEIKAKAQAYKEFENIDEKIKIIPVFTTNEGFEHYEDKKAEFVLEFLMEHVKYTENGIKNQKIAQCILWRSKKAVEICSAHSEGLKGNERYDEIIDTINMLDDLNGQCEAFILTQKEDVKAKKAKEKKQKE